MKTIKHLIYLGIFFLSVKNMNTVYSQTSVYASLGHFDEMEYEKSYLTTADFGVLHQANKFLGIGVGTNMYKFWNRDYSPLGIGLRGIVTGTFFRGANFSLLLEVKGGTIFMLAENSHDIVNYDVSMGPAVEFALNDSKKLKTGIHYNHFSNAKGRGNVINPTWDGFGVDVTLLFGKSKKNDLKH